MADEFKRARAHIQFCLKIYGMQLAAKRHFIHEDPEKSKAWQLPKMLQFLAKPEVNAVTIHMCTYGMKAKD